MIKFFKSLTMTVLLSCLLITVLDPVLRQRMLEGDNVFLSFTDRIEDYFDQSSSAKEETIPPEVEIPPSKEEETKPEEDRNDDIQTPNDTENNDKTPLPEDNNKEEEKDDSSNNSTVVIKPFPNIGKEEPKEEEPPVIEEEPTPTPVPPVEEDKNPVKNPSYTPVYYNQSVEEVGFPDGCLLTSYAMVITNAGRYTGNSKEYTPVDLYLANNPDATAANKRRIIAYHYVIASAFNYSWMSYSLNSKSENEKVNKIKQLLVNNPWGVIIGGSYGNGNTHYIVARLVNGKLVFDDPVKRKGPNIQSISGVHGINTWGNITSVMTITPNLDKNGKWADGIYETKKKNPSAYHICQTQMYC